MPFIQFGVKLLFSFQIASGKKHRKDTETNFCYDIENLLNDAYKYLKYPVKIGVFSMLQHNVENGLFLASFWLLVTVEHI